MRAFIDKQTIDFQKVSSLIDQFLDIVERPKGITTGFYVENRPSPNGDREDVYLRWNFGEEKTESLCLGPVESVEAVDLPNLRTELDKNLDN
ncbi:Two-component system sensor histidine kinase/response regulator hybrid [Crocosphaera watsonii WH 0005]|uniref:Two-component system sensor histidine kinase/response regulator hybrid n=1 Tax=Crocosphaera watsonii WH 0005 TaxID=423472 RepID=T2J319_CROWT|nr:Two-component system sensor histidine kinase/response regulator hybrid [Crocosphaera watsonii WH 0005]